MFAPTIGTLVPRRAAGGARGARPNRARTCQSRQPLQRSRPMHFDNLQPGLSAPLPRLDDDDDDDDEKAEKRSAKNAPVAMLIQKKFLEQRKIFLWGAVTDETAKDLTEKLLYLESDAPGKEITFYINSPGGSVTAGMAVFDTIRLISSPVKVVVTGMAAS